MASVIGCSSDSNRTSILLLVVGRWIQGSGRGVGLGKFAGASVAVTRPRCGAWPRLRASPIAVFHTSIHCALHVECHGGWVGVGEVRARRCLAGEARPLLVPARDLGKHEFE